MKSRAEELLEELLTDVHKLIESLPNEAAKVDYQKQVERVSKLAESDKRANIRAGVKHLNKDVNMEVIEMLKVLKDEVINAKNESSKIMDQRTGSAQEQASRGVKVGISHMATRANVPAPSSSQATAPVAVDSAKMAVEAKAKAVVAAQAQAAAAAAAAESAKGAVAAQVKASAANAAALAAAPASAQELLEKIEVSLNKLEKDSRKDQNDFRKELKDIQRVMIIAESEKSLLKTHDKKSMKSIGLSKHNPGIDDMIMGDLGRLQRRVEQATKQLNEPTSASQVSAKAQEPAIPKEQPKVSIEAVRAVRAEATASKAEAPVAATKAAEQGKRIKKVGLKPEYAAKPPDWAAQGAEKQAERRSQELNKQDASKGATKVSDVHNEPPPSPRIK